MLEALALVYVLGGTLVGLLTGGRADLYLATVLALSALLAVVAVVMVRFAGLNVDLARALAGVTLTFIVYAALPPLLDLRLGAVIDRQLWEMERGLYGTTAVELLAPFASDWLTLLFATIYTVHAPLFFIPAILHWRAGRRGRAERLLLALALAMYAGFVGYAIWPALGPVGTLRDLPPLGTNPATQVVASYGVALGTFPSLHAGICSVVAIDAWRTSWRWGVVFTLIAAGIWSSTLYLRYHWVPDLFAGLLLAVLAYWLAGRVRSELARAAAQRPPSRLG